MKKIEVGIVLICATGMALLITHAVLQEAYYVASVFVVLCVANLMSLCKLIFQE